MIPESVTSLLEPLERFGALQRHAQRLGGRVADLSFANYPGPMLPTVRSVLVEALGDDRDLAYQYSPFGGATPARRAVAEALAASTGLPFEWHDVVLTTGAAAGLLVALHACGEPGDDVVVPVPCWIDHPLYVAAAGRRPVVAPLAASDLGLDVDAVDTALVPRACALLIGHPANPTGRVYEFSELADLAAVLDAHEGRHGRPATLIADEAHRDSAARFETPALAHDRCLIVYSFGKHHQIQGQRLGYVAVSPRHPERDETRAELCRWSRILGNAAPAASMQLAVPGLIALDHDTTDLDIWRRRYTEDLRAAGYKVAPADATPFLYVATPGTDDDAWAARLLAEQHVLVVPAAVFHHHGHFRICLAGTPDTLEQGLSSLKKGAAGWCPSSG